MYPDKKKQPAAVLQQHKQLLVQQQRKESEKVKEVLLKINENKLVRTSFQQKLFVVQSLCCVFYPFFIVLHSNVALFFLFILCC